MMACYVSLQDLTPFSYKNESIMNNDSHRSRRLPALLWLAFTLSACSMPLGIKLPEPLRGPQTDDAEELQVEGAEAASSSQAKTRFHATPKAPIETFKPEVAEQVEQPKLEGEPVSVNIENLPLPAFINEIFGNVLRLSFEIDPALQKKQDLVTLRITEPQPPDQLYRIAVRILEDYGVAVQKQGSVYRFMPAQKAPAGEPPLLVSGRALPSVPVSHRPIFQLVPLKVVRNVNVKNWLQQAYGDQPLKIYEDPERNAILLMGAPPLVEQAVGAIQVLDQPLMRGRHSIRIEPAFWEVEPLAQRLVEVLNTEGYAASQQPPLGSVFLLPIKETKSILVFAADPAILDHVREWALNLDQPHQPEEQKDIFLYSVQNTTADSLAKVLNALLSNILEAPAGQAKPAAGQEAAPARPAQSTRLVVDEARNSLLFYGAGKEWAQLQPLIKKMDKPAKLVLIEVTIAEITLSDEKNWGIEWMIREIGLGDFSGSLRTLGGTGIGASGLTGLVFNNNNTGQIVAKLNAFASNKAVTLVSTPRLMVKSGEEAAIDVGTEIPIATAQGTTADIQPGEGSTGIIQSIQYRRTGTLLRLKPIVHSGGRVDLEISQEVSEARANTLTNLPSPEIFNRKIETQLSLEDGGSVLLGGLISSNKDREDRGVAWLKDIPLIGQLFRSNSRSSSRTELVMLIIPYIVNNAEQAQAVTDAFRERLHFGAPGQKAPPP